MSIKDVGSVASFGYNPTPIGAATTLGGAVLGGKGGGRGHKQTPTYENGKYYIDSTKWGRREVDTSPYVFTGDKGTYDIVPYLQKMHSESAADAAKRQLAGNKSVPYGSMNAYNDIIKAMGDDAKAVAAFKAKYAPQRGELIGFGNLRGPESVNFGTGWQTAAQQAKAKLSGGGMPTDMERVLSFSPQIASQWGNQFLKPAIPNVNTPVNYTPNARLAAQIAGAGGRGAQQLPAYGGLSNQIAQARGIL